MTQYRCSSCSTTSVEVNHAHPSLDERYAMGHCMVCTPWPRPKRNPRRRQGEPDVIQPDRKLVQLVRADVYNEDDFKRRRELNRKRDLVKALQRGDLKDQKAIKQAQVAMAELAGLDQ